MPLDDLAAALSKASMPNKTVIITIMNKAYADGDGDGTTMLDLFLESFWIGEGTREIVDHVLVVAADRTAYDRCNFRLLNCYKMEEESGGEMGGGEDLHVGGIYQVDVEKNSLPPACSPAWLQFHLYGTHFYFLKDPVLVHNI